MPMYYPEWSKHSLEDSTTAHLAFCGEDLATDVEFGFYAEVEVKWSIYAYNQYDYDDFPEPPCFVDLEVEDLTLYINGDEAMRGDTLYSLCHAWAMEQINYYDYKADEPETEGREYDV